MPRKGQYFIVIIGKMKNFQKIWDLLITNHVTATGLEPATT